MPSHHITGLFDVKMLPQADELPPAAVDAAATAGAEAAAAATAAAPPTEATPGTTLGRMRLDKRYHGDLQAAAQGQMLSAMTSTKGSAGYVAIEQVSGQLQGRSGSFVLQHSGLMNRGTPQLAITVVPDSGSGDLAGLAGTMMIRIEGGKHFYDFDYTLP